MNVQLYASIYVCRTFSYCDLAIFIEKSCTVCLSLSGRVAQHSVLWFHAS